MTPSPNTVPMTTTVVIVKRIVRFTGRGYEPGQVMRRGRVLSCRHTKSTLKTLADRTAGRTSDLHLHSVCDTANRSADMG